TQTISISVGVSIFPDHGRDGAELMRAADSALYQAKRAGRNQMAMAPLTPGQAVMDAPPAA
ncbi:MAG: diguanylate cyclase, partial [Anaerolineales bacterium]